MDATGGEAAAHPFPDVEPFREELAAALARTAPHPVGAGPGGNAAAFEACQRALNVIGRAEAVRLCKQRVLDAVARRERQPGTLRFFVECVLGDELTRRASEPKRQGAVIGLDPSTGALIREEAKA